ncbi:gamma-glutamyltransferase 1 [Venturia nashicola]|uniref:Glutathione hydrolase n=1 Tax=Venturia nashicola TaxID=86259 RepID=A0A4Z1PR95_9PEZI|nr:gamma-glutamyltransferase 1 [Venturia nashicola]
MLGLKSLVLACLAAAIEAAPTASSNKLGAVSSESSVCSQIGIDLLKAGGNAADALVGTVFCVGVVAPYHSGIGGGGFMLVRGSNGSYEFIDFRETMPAAGFTDMYNNNSAASLYGGLASGVPGELRGTEHLHQKYGKLPWATVMKPAIGLAFNGFTVSADTVHYFASTTPEFFGSASFLTADPNWAIDFAPNGTLLGIGDTLTRKRYAATLQTIAAEGADSFYTGPIAEATIEAVQNSNASKGIMTLEDLAGYSVESSKPPVSIDYRDYMITAGSAPSGGEVVLSVMKAIEGYSGMGDPSQLNVSTQRIVEATRFAYGQRTLMGDPDFVSNMDIYQKEIINATTAAKTRSLISDIYTQNVSYYNPSGYVVLTDHGTSAITVADASGLVIALTTTVNTLFGSQVIVPSTGVIMNNEMNDFSIPGTTNAFGYVASPDNYVQPGKRPLSSISPTIVECLSTGKFYFATGAAGGSRIITSVLQSLWNVLDKNMTSLEAVQAPRWHNQLLPNVLEMELSYDNSSVAAMNAKGHNITRVAIEATDLSVIRRLANGSFEAAGETRMHNAAGLVA